MILVIICSITLLATLTVFVRRAVEMRANRWQLYALRDELRKVAYEDPSIRTSEVFKVLDARLSVQCAHLDELSLWAILPNVVFGDRQKIENRQRDFITKLNQAHNVKLKPIYMASAAVLARQLAWRHMILTTCGLITVFGMYCCYRSTRWLSQRILSDAVRPIEVPGGVAVPA